MADAERTRAGRANAAVAARAAAVAVLALSGAARAQPAAPASDPALLDRGRYVVEVAASCGTCHDTPGPGGRPAPGMGLAGGRVWVERGFRAVAPNITPDADTGIGRWTDAQLAASVRNGHRPDGSRIGPPMPVKSYRGVSDHDLAAIVAHLRTVPPVRHEVKERSSYPFPLEPHGPPVASVPEPPESDPVARGAYLAINLAHCMDCHSAQLSEGRRDPAGAGATGLVLEGPFGVAVARNISAHPERGIGRWTDEQILRAVTQGVSADGRRLAPPMAGRAPVWSKLTERDQRDLLAYIRYLPPQAN